LNPNRKGPSKCKMKSVVYESRCSLCKEQGSNAGTYIGETGRSLYERSREHLEDAFERKPVSHIFKHWAINHPDCKDMPRFQFKVVNCLKSSMDRQIMEAIRISTDGELNSKCEWRQNQLKRISVHLTEREIAKVEKELELESLETKRALDNLNEKLDSIACTEPINKCVDSNQFQSADITSLNKLSKRKLCPDNQFKAKRSRLNCYLAMPQSIGNIEAKVVGDHPTTTKAPSMMMSFAQAAKSAKIHYMDRFGKTVFKAKNCNEKLELNLNFSNINSSLGSLSVSSRS